MAKIIRPTYPREFSVGLLILIFVLSFFLSSQLFDVNWRDLIDGTPVYLGMFMISGAVIIMVLVLWEEFLFPIKIKPGKDGIVFRNHRNKLNTQLLIYLLIPAAFVFVYLTYDVHQIRFFIWAAICTLLPVLLKLVSGVKNYNDFLRFTDKTIEYKNNTKSGVFALQDVQRIALVRDENNVLHKLKLSIRGNEQLVDLDEMELEAFVATIDQYITEHYKHLIR